MGTDGIKKGKGVLLTCRRIRPKAKKTFEGKLIDFRDVGGKIHIMFEDGSGCALPTKMFKDYQDGDWVRITVKAVQ